MTTSFPRVLLLGGAPMSGKSTVARIIAERHGYSVIATDDLGVAVNAAKRALAKPEPDEDHREYYVVRTVEQLWQEALDRHRALAPAIEAVARMHADWAAPALLEGWAVLPGSVADDIAGVAQVWLIAGREMLESRARADRAFWAGASDEAAMITKFVERSMRLNHYLNEMAKTRAMQLVHLESNESPAAIADRIETLLRS